MHSTTVIAEAGVNHNGRLDLALALVDAAADARADVVKFQTFRASDLVTRGAAQAAYQVRDAAQGQTQYELLKGLELDDRAHRALINRCKERGIEFLSTPFDDASLTLLTEGLGLKRLKVGSGDLTNAPLLLSIARTGRSVILSTGMAVPKEIEEALGVLAFGFLGGLKTSRDAFRQAFLSAEGKSALRNKVVLLQCTSDYPARDEDINLRAIDTLQDMYGLQVGLSDHSVGISVAIAAVARGATMIEKHLTLDRGMAGPDHQASIEPDDFKAMVSGIRQIELALGDGAKALRPSELDAKKVARKSLVARAAIRRGEVFDSVNLAVKRPGTGLAPVHFWELLGRPASRDYIEDELIQGDEAPQAGTICN